MHNDKADGLRQLAGRIEEWRVARGMSKNALCQRFGQLGSTKTYGRILDAKDDLEELNLSNQIENYQAAWELIQEFKDDPEETKIYGDFEFVREALATVSEALEENTVARLVLITAGPGGGKSAILDLLESHRHTGQIVHRVEATEAWRESTNELLGAFLREVGVYDRRPRESGHTSKNRDSEKALPMGPGARLRALIERLDGRRVILAIDEGHHIGPAGYNIVKTIINQAPRVVVVMVAIPDLIIRINRSSHVEAAQLFFNRLFCHVPLGPPEAGDVIEFLKRRGLKFTSPGVAGDIAKKVAADATTCGLWRYVVRCAKEGRKQGCGPFNQESFAQVIVKVKRSISLGS